MNDREQIFSRIRKALAPLPERTPAPQWETDWVISKAYQPDADPAVLFQQQLELQGGTCVQSLAGLLSLLQKEGVNTGYVDPDLLPDLPELEGLEVETTYDPANVDHYGFAITRASAAIAETGTLVFKDADTPSRLAALTPWVHVAVVTAQQILPHLPAALQQLGDDPSVIFATGPSKTADVEGILIQGVHGPGLQVAWILDS
jgi:L-lactate dehydrogenase complex protein LldG